ncbi:MAG: exodeoxyribonuclease III [Spirochaetaceae bacterium]|jgi:exodeoxyribonuclease-3|nr:exodeoxyribonuclease III [Spirochaetaceae bacterium]
MRVLSWNVNGIRAVARKQFTEWLCAESPDALCVQEIKAFPQQVPEELIHPKDAQGHTYHSYWMPAQKPGYAGVCLYSKEEPQAVHPLGINEFDAEGRVLQAEYPNYTIICAYFPSSQEEGRRLAYKIAFCEAIRSLCDSLSAAGRHLILCGDYNIAHTALDLARPQANERNAGYLPEERAWMESFLKAGFVDSFRYLHPDEADCYTWWSYRQAARVRNRGWRLDYCCIDRAWLPALKAAHIKNEVGGSDHCPVEIVMEA